MKKVLWAALVVCPLFLFGQVGNNFNGSINIFSSSGIPPTYTVTGFFLDPTATYTSDSSQVGDVIYAFYTNGAVRFTIDSILSNTGSLITARIIDDDGITAAFPHGVSVIMRETPNHNYPLNISGVSQVLSAAIERHFKMLVDTVSGGGSSQTLSISNDTLSISGGNSVVLPTSLDGNGIYSGSDTLPSDVTVTMLDRTLTLSGAVGSGEAEVFLNMTNPYSSDDAFSQWLRFDVPNDTFQIYNFDGGSYIDATSQLFIAANDGVTIDGPVTLTTTPTTDQTSKKLLARDATTGNLEIYDAQVLEDSLATIPNGSGTTGRVPYWSGSSTLGSTSFINDTDGLNLNGTGAMTLNVGTDAQAPASPSLGQIRVSTTTFSRPRWWNGSAWTNILNGNLTASQIIYPDANGMTTGSSSFYFDGTRFRLGTASFLSSENVNITAGTATSTGKIILSGANASSTSTAADAVTITTSGAGNQNVRLTLLPISSGRAEIRTAGGGRLLFVEGSGATNRLELATGGPVLVDPDLSRTRLGSASSIVETKFGVASTMTVSTQIPTTFSNLFSYHDYTTTGSINNGYNNRMANGMFFTRATNQSTSIDYSILRASYIRSGTTTLDIMGVLVERDSVDKFWVKTDGTGYFAGNLGLGVTAPLNTLGVNGNAVIGNSYAGTNTAPTNGLLVQGNVAIGATTADGALDVTGTIYTNRLIGQNVIPTVLINANAGSSASTSIVTAESSGLAGRFTITTGSGSISAGNWVDFTFSSAFTNIPIVILTPDSSKSTTGGDNAANAMPDLSVVVTTTGFSVRATSDLTGLTSTRLDFQYMIVGGK